MNSFFTWKTKKNQDNTFSYIVEEVIPTSEMQENGHYAITILIRKGVCKTRAKAKRKAILWKRYLES